jgi:hypothetical protein
VCWNTIIDVARELRFKLKERRENEKKKSGGSGGGARLTATKNQQPEVHGRDQGTQRLWHQQAGVNNSNNPIDNALRREVKPWK